LEKALRIKIVGVVQGVGYRPFVYRLATKLSLRGYVVNRGGAEVEIFVEGEDNKLNEFRERLIRDKPPPAYYEEILVEEAKPLGYKDFRILKSIYDKDLRSMIPPDIAICEDCVREIRDKNSRFHNYFWNSCAWCGPRFSMIYRTPYDRENTSMRKYAMCQYCSNDYNDPENIRRFHAQGISCPLCGPRTYIYTSKGEKIPLSEREIINFISKRILEGSIVAIKGVGGYHIASLASRDDVVLELRKRKKRPYKPFALMARDISVVEKIAYLNKDAEKLLKSPERPIVILPKKENSGVSEYVAPGLSSIGIMLPYTGFQVLLFDNIPDGYLIMTSGNIHGRPMCTDLNCVLHELREVIDFVVEHDREIIHRVDDSVIRFTDDQPVFLRRSRGYVPRWIRASFEIGEFVAVGAELQVAGAVSFENKILPTQFIGDLDDPGNLEDLEKELMWFIETYNIKPRAVAIDKHPYYHSREVALRIAEKFDIPIAEIQHHHAHINALMIEEKYDLDEEALGVAIDGTGYGENGEIWGSEIMLTRYRGYKRLASLKPFYLPGGDTAAIYPVKPLISMLASNNYSLEEVLKILSKRDLLKTLPGGSEEAEIAYILSHEKRGVKTSSMGRTLDAFSALLGICTLRTYEGEPPIRLEAEAYRGKYIESDTPSKSLRHEEGILTIDTGVFLEWLLDKIETYKREDLAKTILITIGEALGEAVINVSRGLRLPRNEVLLSGGASVNTYIVKGLRKVLLENDLVLKLHKELPPGDGGIAVGQIVFLRAFYL